MTTAMPPPRVLPHELTIYTAGDCHALFTEWLGALPQKGEAAAAPTMPVDASGVAEVDGAGLQLLLALEGSLAPLGRRLVLERASPGLAAACTNLGAAFLLEGAPMPENAA